MSDDVDTRSDRSDGFRTEIDGRLVVVTIGPKSQTLGVCTPENRPGAYERRYRFLGVPALTPDQLDGVEDLDALTDWVANFGAAVVDESVTGTRRPLPSLIPSVAPGDPWLRATAAIVEHEIDQLVIGFMEEPFLHRVEHSVHAQLFSMLTRHGELSEWHPIGTTGCRTQLVHKEWPETIADVASGSNKRGNFDLAIIAPIQLADATLDHIRTGSVAAGIVIEMGLNYPLSHLDQDYRKAGQ